MSEEYPNERREVVEWGLMLDCELNGCEKPHRDEGLVSSWTAANWGKPGAKVGKINNHKAYRVRRTVIYEKWERA